NLRREERRQPGHDQREDREADGFRRTAGREAQPQEHARREKRRRDAGHSAAAEREARGGDREERQSDHADDRQREERREEPRREEAGDEDLPDARSRLGRTGNLLFTRQIGGHGQGRESEIGKRKTRGAGPSIPDSRLPFSGYVSRWRTGSARSPGRA